MTCVTLGLLSLCLSCHLRSVRRAQNLLGDSDFPSPGNFHSCPSLSTASRPHDQIGDHETTLQIKGNVRGVCSGSDTNKKAYKTQLSAHVVMEGQTDYELTSQKWDRHSWAGISAQWHLRFSLSAVRDVPCNTVPAQPGWQTSLHRTGHNSLPCFGS